MNQVKEQRKEKREKVKRVEKRRQSMHLLQGLTQSSKSLLQAEFKLIQARFKANKYYSQKTVRFITESTGSKKSKQD